jgi:hypothetical protein
MSWITTQALADERIAENRRLAADRRLSRLALRAGRRRPAERSQRTRTPAGATAQ